MKPRLRFPSPVALLLAVVALSACSDPDAEPPDHQLTGVWVEFTDSSTAFVTSDVHDSDREVVHFDAVAHAMVGPDGTSIGGWTTAGNELDWDANSIAFRVLFGSEAGRRRAYFTEASTGTICDLRIEGPDQIKIYPTSEVPPQDR